MTSSLMQQTTRLVASVAIPLFMAGCSSDSDYNFDGGQVEQQRQANVSVAFDPLNGVLPLPNDLLFAGSQDGTLNIPGVADESDFSNPSAALSTLDGFSTIEPISANFSHSATDDPVTLIKAASVILGDTVRIFEVTRTPTGELTDVVGELDATQVAVSMVPVAPPENLNGSQMVIVPVQPLKERTTYMVVLTNGIQDDQDRALARGGFFGLVASPDPLDDPTAAQLQLAVQNMFARAGDRGIDSKDVVMSWTFTTQSTTPVLQQLAANVEASAIALQPTGQATPAGAADIFVGSMSVPYYLEQPSAENPTAPLGTFFTNASGSFLTPLDPVAIPRANVDIPVLMTKPKIPAASGQWPVAIFQHGITRNRGDMLAIADRMASVGYAVIAIDLPMHGIVEGDPDFGALRSPGSERMFDVDYVDNTTGAAGPDGNVDGSGTHFYNLTNLLNTRDNVRQSVSDLLQLSASLSTIDDIDANTKVFIGHSLGAIVGTTFLAFDSSVTSATLSAGGGGLSRLLAASPAFGPRVKAGLASAGVDIDSAEGNQFLNAAQTAVDSVDPVNHAAAASANTPIHMIQINNDTVVINNLPQFPLVGTEALARTMGLGVVSSDTAGGGFVKATQGYHSSLLSPALPTGATDIGEEARAAIFTELQTQTATFAASKSIVITDPTYIATE